MGGRADRRRHLRRRRDDERDVGCRHAAASRDAASRRSSKATEALGVGREQPTARGRHEGARRRRTRRRRRPRRRRVDHVHLRRRGSDWIDERSPVDAGAGLAVGGRARTRGRRASPRRRRHRRRPAVRLVLRRRRAQHRRVPRVPRPVMSRPRSARPTDTCRRSIRATPRARSSPRSTRRAVSSTSSTTNRSTRREFVDAFAHAFGFGRLRFIPPTVVKVVGGAPAQRAAAFATSQQRRVPRGDGLDAGRTKCGRRLGRGRRDPQGGL